MVVKDIRTTGWKCRVMQRATATLVIWHCCRPGVLQWCREPVVIEKRKDDLPGGTRGSIYFCFLLTFLPGPASQ